MAEIMATNTTSSDMELPFLAARELRDLRKDHESSAKAIDLRYVSDNAPGISRIKHGKNCRYLTKTGPVKDEETLARIRSLAIPPAWTDIWICPYANGHLQATGKDARGRKQYRYHPKWSSVRSLTKFHHTMEFGQRLPAIRERLAKDLAKPGLDRTKVLSAVVAILDHHHIRVGNAAYEKENRSFGLSTLKDKHVKDDAGAVRLVFKGKTGVAHDIKIRSRKLARLVMQCRDLPGQELFQYIDDEGLPRPIDSGMVNDHIREISGGEFTSKDFRTWKGTVHCMRALIAFGCPNTTTARKQAINQALDEVAKHLGNTRAVCRKFYVHPEVVSAYECETLQRLVSSMMKDTLSAAKGHTFEEKLVLKVLAAARRKANKI